MEPKKINNISLPEILSGVLKTLCGDEIKVEITEIDNDEAKNMINRLGKKYLASKKELEAADGVPTIKVSSKTRAQYHKTIAEVPVEDHDRFHMAVYDNCEEYLKDFLERLGEVIESMGILIENEVIPVEHEAFYRNIKKMLRLENDINDILEHWED